MEFPFLLIPFALTARLFLGISLPRAIALGCILLGLSARLCYVQRLDTKDVMIDTSLCCSGSFFKNSLSILLCSAEEINSKIKGKDEHVCDIRKTTNGRVFREISLAATYFCSFCVFRC